MRKKGIVLMVTLLGFAGFIQYKRLTKVTAKSEEERIGNDIVLGQEAVTTELFFGELNENGNYELACNIEVIEAMDIKELIVPNYVAVDGTSHQITAVSPSGCSNLRNVESLIISEGIKEIKDWAFYNSDFTRIVFPESLEVINARSFSRVKAMKEVVIPSSVVKIGNGAFLDACSLANYEIKNQNTIIDSNAFGKTSLCLEYNGKRK